MDALVADFHRRTHRALDVKVEAQPVAITLHRPTPAAAHRDGDLPIPGAALRRIDFHHRRVDTFRRTDFTRIQAVIGIEDRFDLAQLGIQRLAKEGRAVLRAEPFAMFAPQQAAILRRQRYHLVGDLLHQHLLLRIAHVQRRAHVQHPGINVAKHAVAQAVAVEQRAELDDVIRQMFGRYAGVLGERNRLGGAFGITQQADGLLAHGIDALHAFKIVTDLPANDARLAGGHQLVQPLAQGSNLLVNQRRVIAGEFDDIEPEHLFIRYVGDQFAYRVPDDILARQIENFRIDGLHRQGFRFDHKGRIAQRRVEGVIFDVDQTAHLRQAGDIQPRFGNKRQRPFRTG